jgi:hypothetical protein
MLAVDASLKAWAKERRNGEMAEIEMGHRTNRAVEGH